MDAATQSYIDGQIKEIFGAEVAAHREFIQRMTREAEAKNQLPPWMVSDTSPVIDGSKMPKGASMGRIVASAVAGKLSGRGVDGALKYAEAKWGKGPEMEPVVRALQASDGGTGAIMITPQVSRDWIEYLRPDVVVRSIDPRPEALVGGTLSIPKVTGTTTATYRGENVVTNANPNPTAGFIYLSAKELISKIPISNKLIRYAGATGTDVEARVMYEMKRQIALREDLAFIRGDGTSNTPRGLLNWVNSANKTGMTATPTDATVIKDLGKLEFLIRNANIMRQRQAWLFSARTENFLKYLRNTQGGWIFKDEMNAGTLLGRPYRATTQIPDNLGGGTNESEVYLVEAAHVILADSLDMQVATTTEGSYTDANGVSQNAFDRDETVVRMITEHDLGVDYDKAIAILTAVTWSN